jgi:endonuclease-3 related protein
MMRETLLDIYDRFWRHFGPQHWWPGDTSLEIIVGAILTQSTNWANVAKAIVNLKQAHALTLPALSAMPDDALASLIRPSGYYHAKTRKLRAFVDLVRHEYEGDLDRLLALDTHFLRAVLLATHGIGPETADSIILYAANKPVFVIDAYTRRIMSRLGLCPAQGRYQELQDLFMSNLDREETLFNEYHALFVHLGKTTCTKRDPRCASCPVGDICPTGRTAQSTRLASEAANVV